MPAIGTTGLQQESGFSRHGGYAIAGIFLLITKRRMRFREDTDAAGFGIDREMYS